MHLMTVILFACVASTTLACRCWRSEKEKVSTAAFYIRADVKKETNVFTSRMDYFEYHLIIRNEYKWPMNDNLVDRSTLITPMSGSMCGGRLTVGATYTFAGTFRDIVGNNTKEMYLGSCKIARKETKTKNNFSLRV